MIPTNTFDLNSLKSIADSHRAQLPENNHFGIGELLNKPVFFDWVECRPKENIHFKMFLAGADDGVAMRFFWNSSYERTTLSLFGEFAKNNGVILDIGAHTGAYTLAALACNPESKVLSFEPHFMNFSRLNLNLRGNNYTTNGAYMIGIGERNEILPFSIAPNLSYLTSGGRIGSKDNSIVSNIQAVALDKFLPEGVAREVSLIKIDVEGHEGACLRGMISLISESRPIIFIECIEGESGKDLSSILQNLGYYFCLIDDGSGKIVSVESIEPQMDKAGVLNHLQLNRVAVPNKKILEQVLSYSL
jgi:FkbM family methyltransferase